MQWLFLAINLINMRFCRATWGRAVIGCGYGAPQPITALPQVVIYSLTWDTLCPDVYSSLALVLSDCVFCSPDTT